MSARPHPKARASIAPEDDVDLSNMLAAISPARRRVSDIPAKLKYPKKLRAPPYMTPPTKATPRKVESANHKENTVAAGGSSGVHIKVEKSVEEELDDFDFDAYFRREENREDRKCSRKQCKAVIPGNQRYKTCDRCRAKSREQQRRVRDRKHEEQAKQERASSPFKYEEELRIPDEWSHISPDDRFKNYMDQLRAMGKLRSTTLGKRVALGNPAAIAADSSEYRTSDDLYTALMRAVMDSHSGRQKLHRQRPVAPVDFRGCYYVVQNILTPITKYRVSCEADRAEYEAYVPLRYGLLSNRGMISRPWNSSSRRDAKSPIVHQFVAEGQLAYKLQYDCACRQDGSRCGGIISIKIAKVMEGVTAGEKITIRVKHAKL